MEMRTRLLVGAWTVSLSIPRPLLQRLLNKYQASPELVHLRIFVQGQRCRLFSEVDNPSKEPGQAPQRVSSRRRRASLVSGVGPVARRRHRRRRH